MKLLNMTDAEWAIAEEYFENHPNAVKMSKRKNPNYPKKPSTRFATKEPKPRDPSIHSFIKLQDKLYAIENKLEMLGEGSFANLKRVEDKDGNNFAMKIEGLDKANASKEIAFMKAIGIFEAEGVRDIIPKMFKNFYEVQKRYTVSVLKQGKDLYEDLKYNDFTQTQKIIIAIQCAKDLNFLHQKYRIIHTDIKPENVIGIIKGHKIEMSWIDFGLSKFLPEDKEYVEGILCGTPDYIAPEIGMIDALGRVQLKKTDNGVSHYSFASDIYALGKLLENDLMLDAEYFTVDGKSMIATDVKDRPLLDEIISHLVEKLSTRFDIDEDVRAIITAHQEMHCFLENGKKESSESIELENSRTLEIGFNSRKRKSEMVSQENETVCLQQEIDLKEPSTKRRRLSH